MPNCICFWASLDEKNNLTKQHPVFGIKTHIFFSFFKTYSISIWRQLDVINYLSKFTVVLLQTYCIINKNNWEVQPSPCIMLFLVLGKSCVIQVSCFTNCLLNIWLKEDSFTYALRVMQGFRLSILKPRVKTTRCI